jgi:hypothetical protein
VLSCSPVWYLGHYSNVFNSKSNVIVTLSEHVDGNFKLAAVNDYSQQITSS